MEIAGLYNRPFEIMPTPVVALNRAVAIGMADGPAIGLAMVDELAGSGMLPNYPLLMATRADFLRRLERPTEAAAAYRTAIEAAGTDAEHRYLTRRLAELTRLSS